MSFRNVRNGLAGLVVALALPLAVGLGSGSKREVNVQERTEVDSRSFSEVVKKAEVGEGYSEYVVKKGDSLWEIATKKGVGLKKLAAANPKYNTLIRPGDVLKIPAVEKSDSLMRTIRAGSSKYSSVDLLAIAMYAEAATENDLGKGIVGRSCLNRVLDPDYPDTLYGVVFEGLSSKGSRNWRQATGKLKMKDYEEKVWENCRAQAESLLKGRKLGILYEEQIIAFDDVNSFEKVRATRPNDPYWKHMEKVGQSGKIVYFIDKRKVN